jgi:hypothetical protein
VGSHVVQAESLPFHERTLEVLGMGALIQILSLVLSLVSLVCFVMVLVQMFQHGQTGLGIACIVLALCGIGVLIAFVYGWIKSNEWNIKNLMLAWTGAIVVNILLSIVGIATGATPMPAAG